MGVIDLSILNRSFTWSNSRRIPTLECLDRAFISQGWLSSSPQSTLRALPRPKSDHTPLLLSAFSFVSSSYLFRFESFWLRYPSLNGVATNSWNSAATDTDPSTSFHLKIKQVSDVIKTWSTGISSSIIKQAHLCLSWIEWLDKAEEGRSLSDLEFAMRPKLKERYEELCLQDELKWRQRSCVQWLKAGDANT